MPAPPTKQEFIARWRFQLAGIALYGVAAVPKEAENLLAAMYDDLVPAAVRPSPRKCSETCGIEPASSCDQCRKKFWPPLDAATEAVIRKMMRE